MIIAMNNMTKNPARKPFLKESHSSVEPFCLLEFALSCVVFERLEGDVIVLLVCSPVEIRAVVLFVVVELLPVWVLSVAFVDCVAVVVVFALVGAVVVVALVAAVVGHASVGVHVS